jgi:hypothetical protein
LLNTLPGTKGDDSDHLEVVALGVVWARGSVALSLCFRRSSASHQIR